MYENLVAKNPDIKIHRTSDKEFIQYGRAVEGVSADEFIAAAKSVPMPESGSAYVASLDAFEATAAAKDLAVKCFGEMPTEVGYCYGSSNQLNAVEWHKSSEINVAVTPLVLILGSVQDIKDGKIDSSLLKAFYVEKGEVIEVYATTLHFCPCQVQEGGFGCVVALPAGTNTPLEGEYEDKLLFRKNKWILSHVDNKALIDRGVVPGVTGINYTINYK